jgi:DNA-binding GntR family transcriptional regulator
MATPGSGHSADNSPPEGLQDYVSRRISEAIVTGELAAGQKLSPAKLAADFGVSHIPVREALAALEASGYVRRSPRIGFFVAELSSEYMADVYHWRQVLEDEAHRVAVPRLDTVDIAKMRATNDALNAPGAEEDARSLYLNREFHFLPFQRADSPILLRFLGHLWDAAARYQNTIDRARVSRAVQHEQHEGLLQAFEARDLDLVNERMAEHRSLTLESIRELQAAARPAPGA